MARSTSIIIADDHPIVRAGVRMLAESREGIELVGEASNRAETLEVVAGSKPDILVLDLWLGEDDGLEVLREIRKRKIGVRVLVYSMSDENLYGLRAIEAGADGYLMKDRGLEELGIAIEKIAAGHRYIGDALTDKVIDASIKGEQGGAEEESVTLRALTDRELHILRLIGRGKGTGEIARVLCVSPKTIGAHRENLKNKLGADSAEELVRLAVTYVEQHAI